VETTEAVVIEAEEDPKQVTRIIRMKLVEAEELEVVVEAEMGSLTIIDPSPELIAVKSGKTCHKPKGTECIVNEK
jgi:hypothetical protein